MTTFQLILIAGLALGVLQLAVGLAIGFRIGRRDKSQSAPNPDQERAETLAADLRGLTDFVSRSVRRHNEAIGSIDERLRAETEDGLLEGLSNNASAAIPTGSNLGESPLTHMIVGVVGEMLAANRELQKELNHAEAELERQSGELIEHRQQSLTDPLTGLPNRRALDDHLRARMDAWRKHASPFSVLMLDIDFFKRFNDTHGHQAGDQALKQFGEAISGALRKHDIVARYGGEEFAVLLPYATLSEAAAAVAKVRNAIAAVRVNIQGQSLTLSASGGLAGIQTNESSEALFGRADEALYAAKDAGRDCVFLHNGVKCVPLNKAALANEAFEQQSQQAPSDADPLLDEPEAALSDSLQDACAELRAGMQNFVDQPS